MAAVLPLPVAGAGAAGPDRIDARWVVSGLRGRVLLPLALALILLVCALTAMIVYSGAEQREEDVQETAVAIRNLMDDRMRRDVRNMQTMAELLSTDAELAAAFRARDRDAMLARAQPLVQALHVGLGVSQLTFIQPDRKALLRIHAPTQFGDLIQRASLRDAERKQDVTWRMEQGVLGTLTLRLVFPWRERGQLLGYLDLGVEFEELTAELKRATRAELFLTVDKSRLDAAAFQAAPWNRSQPVAWDEFPQVMLASRTIADLPPALRDFLARAAKEQEGRNFTVDYPGHRAQVFSQPLTQDGVVLGQLLVMQDLTADWREQREAIVRLAATTALIGGALLLFFYFLLGKVQKDVAGRTARLEETRTTLVQEQQERQRAQRDLQVQQERNELLEARGRMVEELAAATETARHALRENEEITRKLRDAQGELVATARQAGRAEIATNVLHNVGNILNSVNIAAGVIAATLRRSRVGGLARGLGMLRAHENDLAKFLTEDEKGRMLPGYLLAAADALAAEHEGMAEEVGRLVKSIDHIKDIVATQQSHALAGHVCEPVRPESLAEDALRMQETALLRHQVSVVREFAALPVVPLDRARVLQILVNLISNAKSAISAGPGGTGVITLRIAMADEQHLLYEVADTGEGIAPENLTRIFAHGFTTRSDGHGFGLHSSALAARELGGTLTVRSEGAGRGATFSLLLPLQPPRRS